MFGSFGLIKFLNLPLALLVAFVAFTSEAQTPRRQASSQKAVITVPEATVFKEADFDGPVLGSLREGQVYDISVRKLGPFYRIRIRPGVMGWISEAEVQVISLSQARQLEGERRRAQQEGREAEASPARRSSKEFDQRRFRGFVLESVNFKEDTMAASRQESLLFYGFKMSGPGTLFEGELETDAEILIHPGAPSYYRQATGNSASGFIVIGNFLFLTQIPQSETMMPYYGFGPSFRLSHFKVSLSDDPTPGNSRSYTLEDLTLGAVFAGGVAFSFRDYALRLEGRYYWEAQRYTSFGLAFQKEF